MRSLFAAALLLYACPAFADCRLNGQVEISGTEILGSDRGDLVVCSGIDSGRIDTGAGDDLIIFTDDAQFSGEITTGAGDDTVLLRPGAMINGTVDTGTGGDRLRLTSAAVTGKVLLGPGDDRVETRGVSRIAGEISFAGGDDRLTVREGVLRLDGSEQLPWGRISMGSGRDRVIVSNALLQSAAENGGRIEPPQHFSLETEGGSRVTLFNATLKGFSIGFRGRRSLLQLLGITEGARVFTTGGRNSAFLGGEAAAETLHGGPGPDRFIIKGSAVTVEGGAGQDEILFLGPNAAALVASGGRLTPGYASWSDDGDVVAVCGGSVGYLSASSMRVMSGSTVPQILVPTGPVVASLEIITIRGTRAPQFALAHEPAALDTQVTEIRHRIDALRYCEGDMR